MRDMGKLSGVEIEPEKQSQLLDASTSMAGVVGGGVPGGTRISPFFYCSLTDVSHSGWIRCCMAARVCTAGGHAWDPAAPTRRAALDDEISRRCTDARAREQGPGCRD